MGRQAEAYRSGLTVSVIFATSQNVTGKDIIALRKALKLTQQQLADRIGAFRETVARWESGKHQPRGANLKALVELQKEAKKKRT